MRDYSFLDFFFPFPLLFFCTLLGNKLLLFKWFWQQFTNCHFLSNRRFQFRLRQISWGEKSSLNEWKYSIHFAFSGQIWQNFFFSIFPYSLKVIFRRVESNNTGILYWTTWSNIHLPLLPGNLDNFGNPRPIPIPLILQYS